VGALLPTMRSTPLCSNTRRAFLLPGGARYADVLLVTGPVTSSIHDALLAADDAMPDPRLVVALGDCALGCCVLGDPQETLGGLERVRPAAIRLSGCPPTPSEIARRLLDGLDAVRDASGPAAPELPRAR